MEGLNPTLRFILEVRFALENGESVRAGVIRGAQGYSDTFTNQVRAFLFGWDRGEKRFEGANLTLHQRHLLSLIAYGLQGHPIRPQLLELQEEVEQACREQIEDFIRMIPFKMAIPLLLLQFPAFLILLLGPLLENLIRGLQ